MPSVTLQQAFALAQQHHQEGRLAEAESLYRQILAVARPVIRDELGISLVMMGWITFGFRLAYALFQIPGGWLGDRFGARKALTAVVTWWARPESSRNMRTASCRSSGLPKTSLSTTTIVSALRTKS